MPNRYKFLLLCSMVLVVYYPSIFAEVSLLDDMEMLKGIENIHNFSMSTVFLPHSQGGMYYRPLIHLSFLADSFLWDLDPAIMHFENILLHLFNSILVMLIAHEMPCENIRAKKWFPLVASLFFAVHPIATESVDWISGRTDLLSTFFVLLSCYFVFKYRNFSKSLASLHFSRMFYLSSAFIFLLLGILSKEPAVGFIPAMVFILFGKVEKVSPFPANITSVGWAKQSVSNANASSVGQGIKQPLLNLRSIAFIVANVSALLTALVFYNYLAVITIAVCYGIFLVIINKAVAIGNLNYKRYIPAIAVSLAAFIGIFWGIRKVVFASQSSQVARTFKLLFYDLNYTISVFLKAYGFYVKKFFLPLPLNLVIREVNIAFSFLGIIVLCAAIVLITRRKPADMLAIAGLCMIAPVLPLTFDSIAWTSYAERYVYPAAPLWILSISAYLSPIVERISSRNARLIAIATVALIVLMCYFTFNRNLVWQTNISIFKDSVEKTDSYIQLRGLYITALYEKGYYDEAVVQYRIAESLPVVRFKYDGFSLFYARILLHQAKYNEAELVLNKLLKKAKNQDPDIYAILIELESSKMQTMTTQIEKMSVYNKMINFQKKWYELTKDPIHLYQLGQLYLLVNNRKSAKVSFEEASKNKSLNSCYRDAARKLAVKL